MRWVGFTRAGLTLPIIWRRAMEKRSVTKWDSDPAEEFGFARQINPMCTSSLSSLVPAVSCFLRSPCTCRLCFVYALLFRIDSVGDLCLLFEKPKKADSSIFARFCAECMHMSCAHPNFNRFHKFVPRGSRPWWKRRISFWDFTSNLCSCGSHAQNNVPTELWE